jgi:hypothetical protein
MGMIDHQLMKTRPGKPLDMTHDQRLAGDRQQWLGQSVGEGAHPLATTGGQYHGFHFFHGLIALATM